MREKWIFFVAVSLFFPVVFSIHRRLCPHDHDLMSGHRLLGQELRYPDTHIEQTVSVSSSDEIGDDEFLIVAKGG